ncbi:MAG: amino-acid N-acetyltransferase [Chitinivibrionales bacterium]|nr:amino-acid N-acetyltransferase [Chitinivibrionales bacterium]
MKATNSESRKTKIQLKSDVETIREAFEYINRFKNETFVIKIESSLIAHPYFAILIKDIVLLHKIGINIILVPGAKVRINEILKTYNVSSKFVDDTRITSADAIPFIKMAAFDVSNRIMTMLSQNHATAVVGNWVKARSIGIRKGVDFQHSGLVEKIDGDKVKKTLAEGIIPIFPNIGWNAQGKPYNISSNELAMSISTELKAKKLFFLSECSPLVAEFLKVPKKIGANSENLITQLTVEEAESLLAANRGNTKNPQNKPMLEYIDLACKACQGGVERVHIVDGRVEGMMLKEIFSNRGLGTMVYSNVLENIRPMAEADIPEVLHIMQPLVEEGVLLSRSADDLHDKMADFCVYEVDGIIHGCGALFEYPGKQAEIGGIVVDEIYANGGIGKRIILYLLQRASFLKIREVFLLTTQTIDWFLEFGFREGLFKDLPKQKQETYNKKRNSRILKYKIPKKFSAENIGVE